MSLLTINCSQTKQCASVQVGGAVMAQAKGATKGTKVRQDVSLKGSWHHVKCLTASKDLSQVLKDFKKISLVLISSPNFQIIKWPLMKTNVIVLVDFIQNLFSSFLNGTHDYLYVKRVAQSDKTMENYDSTLQFISALRSFTVSFGSLFWFALTALVSPSLDHGPQQVAVFSERALINPLYTTCSAKKQTDKTSKLMNIVEHLAA